jgi:hypothetical protein
VTAVNPFDVRSARAAAAAAAAAVYGIVGGLPDSFDRLHAVRIPIYALYSQSFGFRTNRFGCARVCCIRFYYVDDVIVLRIGDVVDKTGNHVTANINKRWTALAGFIADGSEMRTQTVLSVDQFLST